MLRIVLVVIGIAVLVYMAVKAVQRRGADKVGPPPALPVTRSSPRVERDYQRTVRERAERQRRGTAEAEPPAAEAPAIVVEEDVFLCDDDAGSCNELFVVVSTASTEDVVAAVQRANARFMLVDEHGTEHSDPAALEAAFAAQTEGDLYTPNYTADPVVTDAGVEGYVDCKGAIADEMGRTLRRVLREELERLGRPTRAQVPPLDG